VIAMGEAMKLEVLAEGVETVRQRDILVREGCKFGQGYYFCPPVEPDELRTWEARNK
jgi:EAL domain-containing protein (putative c-di-GMP-specific phosphodiesterase class I)